MRSPKEFDTKEGDCHLCKQVRIVTLLKAAHVPLYAWVCDDCWNEWAAE